MNEARECRRVRDTSRFVPCRSAAVVQSDRATRVAITRGALFQNRVRARDAERNDQYLPTLAPAQPQRAGGYSQVTKLPGLTLLLIVLAGVGCERQRHVDQSPIIRPAQSPAGVDSNLGDGVRLTALPLMAAEITRDPASRRSRVSMASGMACIPAFRMPLAFLDYGKAGFHSASLGKNERSIQ